MKLKSGALKIEEVLLPYNFAPTSPVKSKIHIPQTVQRTFSLKSIIHNYILQTFNCQLLLLKQKHFFEGVKVAFEKKNS